MMGRRNFGRYLWLNVDNLQRRTIDFREETRETSIWSIFRCKLNRETNFLGGGVLCLKPLIMFSAIFNIFFRKDHFKNTMSTDLTPAWKKPNLPEMRLTVSIQCFVAIERMLCPNIVFR